MRLAIVRTRVGIATVYSPFWSATARDGLTISVTHITAWRELDPTAPAEANCVRDSAAALSMIDRSGSLLCPTRALSDVTGRDPWVESRTSGLRSLDRRRGEARISELSAVTGELVERGRSPVVVEGGLLREEITVN